MLCLACHILLGGPWLYDKDMVHGTKTNTYSFHKDGEKLISQPLNEEVTNPTKTTTPKGC